MARTWRDIFGIDEEIHTAVTNAVNNDRRTNLFTYVQDGAMTIDYAARQANLSTAEFEENMRNAGFSVPQSTLV